MQVNLKSWQIFEKKFISLLSLVKKGSTIRVYETTRKLPTHYVVYGIEITLKIEKTQEARKKRIPNKSIYLCLDSKFYLLWNWQKIHWCKVIEIEFAHVIAVEKVVHQVELFMDPNKCIQPLVTHSLGQQ